MDALRFVRNSERYTAMAIRFATVILFAALAGKIRGERNRLAMLALAAAGLLGGAAVLLRLPLSI